MSNRAAYQAEKQIKEFEEKLIELYKHMGSINCRLGILLDLIRKSRGKSGKKIIEHIINCAGSLSQAELVVVYRYQKKENSFYHLACNAANKKNCRNTINVKKHLFLYSLIKKKIHLQGFFKKGLFRKNEGRQSGYFLFLPLVIKNSLKGIILIGFQKEMAITTQDLSFYEAFAIQSSYMLENSSII